MSNQTPSVQEWKNLYERAMEFKDIECWNYMYDCDVFGVQNPENGEIGYCCIMGNAGELFALAVYLGAEGLEGLKRIQSGEKFASPTDVLHCQKCLMASFEDREYLEKKDLQVIRALGLKFRGHNSWPLFRNYLPGYSPWFLSSDEAIYLTLALRQVVAVALRYKNNPEMLNPPRENQFFVRVPKKDRDDFEWTDAWLEPSPLKETETVDVPVDEQRLEKINRTIAQRQGIWEIDSFYSSRGVREKAQRPYYPYLTFCVEHHSGLILTFQLAKAAEHKSRFVGEFLNFVENIEFLPKEILVKKEETFHLLEPIASNLGIRLVRVAGLPALEQARAAMARFLDR